MYKYVSNHILPSNISSECTQTRRRLQFIKFQNVALCTHIYTQTHTHTYTHTYIYTHINTHTHTHTFKICLSIHNQCNPHTIKHVYIHLVVPRMGRAQSNMNSHSRRPPNGRHQSMSSVGDNSIPGRQSSPSHTPEIFKLGHPGRVRIPGTRIFFSIPTQ